MLKLIKLEWKKNNIGKYIRNAVILAVFLCLFIFADTYLGLANDPVTGLPDSDAGSIILSETIEVFSSISFLVFTSVMLSSFIVSAYKNKTMNLMFSYPIKRQTILISQMLAVWIFCFLALIITRLLLFGCILLGSFFMSSPYSIDFNMLSFGFYIQLIVKSVVVVTMSFIALFIGLAMKSSKATITASFLLIVLTQASIGDLTMSENMVFPAILTVVSLVFAFLSIRKVETNDLM